MKKINLLTINNIFISNPKILLESMIKSYLGIKAIKEKELETLNRLCLFFKKNMSHHSFFENYYINYKIEQLDKEFDLLRIGKNSILNIELISEKIDEDKIQEQLEKNYYYLSFLDRPIYSYAFVNLGHKDILYYYDAFQKRVEKVTDISVLRHVLQNLDDINDENLDNLFDPSNYLISPFHTTKKFMESKYFLTKNQEEIKDEILESIFSENTNKIFSISGNAGTGKTLLTYDIGKRLLNENKNLAIIHCAQTNDGIDKLNSKYGWNIISISSYRATNLSSCDVLIIDEAQRISKNLLEKILEDNKDKYIIFAHDVHQKMNRIDDARLVVEAIEQSAGQKKYQLKNKIRHNKSLASFMKKFYDLSTINSDNLIKKDYKDISLYFTEDNTDATCYIEHLKTLGWEHIYLTNNVYKQEALGLVPFSARTNSHEVIGQEYDNVVITLDDQFYYTNHEKLSCKEEAYYNPVDTLFQAMTRTRKKLTFVIVNNESVYEKCVQIVNRD